MAHHGHRIQRSGTVVFDCDSTLSAIEGIEALAHGRRPEIERLTERAMTGEVPLEQVYGRRLALIRPGRADLERLAAEYVAALVPDAREVTAALQREGVAVRVLSGGLRPAVHALAHTLGIADGDVAAVDIRFDDAGRYAGYDADSPLARSGGKAEVLAEWRSAVPLPILLVGDGATDVEARPAADLFVVFAGVVERAIAVEAADVVVRARSLAPILPLALGGERPRDPAAGALFEKGLALLDAADRDRLLHESTAET
jgi:phosphoserine phosphatase